MEELDIYKSSCRLRALRKEKGLSHKTLAESVGVTEQLIKNYEKAALNQGISTGQDKVNAIAGMSIKTLYKLANYLGVSSDYLLGLTDVPTRDTNLGAVCDYSGLTPSACEYLHRCQGFSKLPDWPEAKEFLNTVNLLLEDVRSRNTEEEEFRRPILGLISFFFRYADTTHERAVIYDDGKILKGKAKPDSRLVSALSIDETLVENALLLELQQALKNLKQVLLERSEKENGKY